MKERAERVIARCRKLAQISDVQGETTRTFLSPAMRRANALVATWMEAAGMMTRVDAAGNLRARRGDGPAQILIGSHLDTVVNAGAFDGVLGVMLAIEAVNALGTQGLGMEVIAFSEEEGVRFATPFLGSRAVVGTLDQTALALRDTTGVSVAEAIETYGLHVDDLHNARLDAKTKAYLEIHIEQGPVLEAEDRPLAVVSAIAGQTRLRIRFTGHANHAGTTPMHLRHDALAAAAEWISHVEARANAEPGLVATVGSVAAQPGVVNVVPGVVTASLDIRHAQDTVRRVALEDLLESATAAAQKRGVMVSQQVTMEQTAVAMDAELTRILEDSAASCGYHARPLTSGAGHDAMVLAPHVPTAMLFVRTPGGLSHHPDEDVRVEDVEAALRTTMEFLGRLELQERGGVNA